MGKRVDLPGLADVAGLAAPDAGYLTDDTRLNYYRDHKNVVFKRFCDLDPAAKELSGLVDLTALHRTNGNFMNPEARKHALRSLTHGLYVVTATDGEETAAAGVTWLTQASFTPPLVMVGVKVDSNLHALVERAGSFAVSVVGQGQQDMAAAFFRPSQIEGDRINGYRFVPGPVSGAPLLLDAPCWFEARVTDFVKRGDHSVVVAEVVEAGVRDVDLAPLALRDTPWHYGG